MQSLNRWCGIGRLGRDPEVKKTQTGISVCSFSIACERRRNSTQEQSETDWINCVAWRGTADALAAYAHKGDQIGIEGRLQARSYEKDGKKVYVTEVQCDLVQLLGHGSGSEQKQESTVSTYDQIDHDLDASATVSNNTSYSRDDIRKEIADDQRPYMDLESDDLPF